MSDFRLLEQAVVAWRPCSTGSNGWTGMAFSGGGARALYHFEVPRKRGSKAERGGE